jgi:hypothetical protein
MNKVKMSRVKSTDLPNNPDFSFIQGRVTPILESAYNVMCENPIYWDILFNYTEYSYIFTNNQDIINLMNLIFENSPDKSGETKSWIMLQLELIILKGFTIYKDYYTRGIIISLK